MPRQLTVTETRLNTITAYLTPAIQLLDEVNDAFGSSILRPISKTTLSLIVGVQVTNLIISQWRWLTIDLESEEE
jgi:energy-converting hydrogenase Eha subunit F